jgi:hypothetical protein
MAAAAVIRVAPDSQAGFSAFAFGGRFVFAPAGIVAKARARARANAMRR